jgi:hypothetical protein
MRTDWLCVAVWALLTAVCAASWALVIAALT